jgi:hypothetical protein
MEALSVLSTLDNVSLASVFFGILTFGCVANFCFNAFFHPLSTYPGPRMAAASGWWLAYHEVFREQSLTNILFSLHQRYGIQLPTTQIHATVAKRGQVPLFDMDLIR